MPVLYPYGALPARSLTLTLVVFEFLKDGHGLASIKGLTLTLVVFEYGQVEMIMMSKLRLTLTLVVFESPPTPAATATTARFNLNIGCI